MLVRRTILCGLLSTVFASGYVRGQTPVPTPTPTPAPLPPAPPTPTPTPVPTPAPLSLSITGQTSVPAGGQAILTLSGATSPASVVWEIWPRPTSQYTDGLTIVFTGTGCYQVDAICLTMGQLLKVPTAVNFTHDTLPMAIAIFDPMTLTSLPAGQASIYQSATIGPALQSQGIQWLQYHSTDVLPTHGGTSASILATKWGSQAMAAGLPALVTSAGGIVNAVPLPANEGMILTNLGRFKRK
jgi:hypothetical protein